MKYFGCAYYPEAWEKTRWETDFRMMRDLGFNMVRLGEFNWGKFEPEEGVFHFDDYLEILDLADRYGIRVMMCTPTAAVPRWRMIPGRVTVPLPRSSAFLLIGL